LGEFEESAALAKTRTLVLDTSAIVALLCGWHVRHADVRARIEERISSGFSLAIPAHALVETYAVLTRLPPPYRISASDARQLLESNFRRVPILTLTAREHWLLVEEAQLGGVAGGRMYDALIARCAKKAVAPTLLTLNVRHFASFEDEDLALTAV
jgi:predicted nucleic acid-binding protein